MREIVTQFAVTFIVWSVAAELTGWAMNRWLGEKWWRKMLGERRPAEPQQPPVAVRTD